MKILKIFHGHVHLSNTNCVYHFLILEENRDVRAEFIQPEPATLYNVAKGTSKRR